MSGVGRRRLALRCSSNCAFNCATGVSRGWAWEQPESSLQKVPSIRAIAVLGWCAPVTRQLASNAGRQRRYWLVQRSAWRVGDAGGMMSLETAPPHYGSSDAWVYAAADRRRSHRLRSGAGNAPHRVMRSRMLRGRTGDIMSLRLAKPFGFCGRDSSDASHLNPYNIFALNQLKR